MPPFTPYLSSPPSLYNFQPLNSITHQIRHSFAALTAFPSFALSTPCSFTLVLAEARTTHVALQYETNGGKEKGDERE
jgi:hypothetical protein